MVTIPVLSGEYIDRLRHRESSAYPELWEILDHVKDPEIPVLSIWDLGVLQDIVLEENGIAVVITPTYSGCPAMEAIKRDIHQTLSSAGYTNVRVEIRLSPAWSTDWMSPEGLERLKQYGIAPPLKPVADGAPLCPQCGSPSTVLISEFGSTACKALFKCEDCLEPFDYFKCL